MDLSKLSDEDLKALYANDYKKLSDEGLKHVHSEVSQEKVDEKQLAAAEEPKKEGPVSPGDWIADKASEVAGNLAGAGQVAMEHPLLTGAGALAAGKVLGNIPVVGPAVTNAANYVAGKTIPGYNFAKNVMQGAGGAVEKFAGQYAGAQNATAAATQAAADLDTYKALQKMARADAAAGRAADPKLAQMLDELHNRIVGSQQAAGAAPKGGSVAPTPTAPTQAAPQTVRVAPAQAATTAAPEVEAAAQAARAAAPAAEAGGGIMSRMAPYLQGIGKIAAPVARVAGPLGMAASLYEAAPYIKQADIGERTKSGEVKALMNAANRMAMNMPTPAPLSPTEAKNLLDSGDERTIKIYGGRQRLQQMANPNAINSGFARQLNSLGR
jgi:hypothetical protein